MEEAVKEDRAQRARPAFLSKAGWVKKAHGRLLTSYKDRYVHVEKTEVVVYESEDLQNCLERLDLENYETCHELKSPFKKKQRLVLIRSAKSGNKVHDVKFQTQTVEEKEAWIRALSDCISRAKNKVFDEVKVDESSNLEHITRTRPQGNRNRRPPTRIHMKEVADVSSDGLLRLDLDLEDAVMPNGTNKARADGSEPPETDGPPDAAEKQSVLNKGNETKPIKPPMPPTKEAKSSVVSENEPIKQDEEEKVVKPPMPPSKESKPCGTPEEGNAGPPPTPPSKDKKPPISVVEPNQQTYNVADEHDDDKTGGSGEEVDQSEETVPKGEPQTCMEKPKEPEREKPSPDHPPATNSTAADTLAGSPAVAVCLSDPQSDTLNLSPLLCHLPGEKKKKAEEKSVDSGQHSDDESEGSVSEDVLAASTAAVRGSRAGLDVLDADEDDSSVSLRPSAELQVKANAFPCRRSEPFQKPLKPSIKPRSASIGDLLSDSVNPGQLKTPSRAEGEGAPAFTNSVSKLETEVALEMKDTSELLSQAQGRNDGEAKPEDLLAKALEKLQKADCVLREVQKLKLAKNPQRMSW